MKKEMICKMYAVKDIKVFDKKLKAPGGSILIYSLLSINRRIDPSNTGLLRRAFEKEFKKRFQELKRVLVEAVLDRNVFGLQPINYLHLCREPLIFLLILRRLKNLISG